MQRRVCVLICSVLFCLAACQRLEVPELEPIEESTTAPTLGLWSDPETWGGQVPQAGDIVEIPDGKKVVLDVDSPVLAGLYIDGELSFAEKDLKLSSDWILVQGALRIGSKFKPFSHKAVINLTGGAQASPVSDGIGHKALGVVGGHLALYGQEKLSWTRLARTAKKGDNSLLLEAVVDWQAGDRIVLASTDFDFKQAEELVVVSTRGNEVFLNKNLSYDHYGVLQAYENTWLDERAEVGLLSRNIVIQGDRASEEDGFGGHIIARAKSQVHLSGVELRRMGQTGLMGRYPIHWHLAKDDSRGSYIKNSSLHTLYNRCVTIHGSNGVLVENNVAYNTLGHCYFLEDGAEFDNVFQSNLGLGTRAPKKEQALLRSDHSSFGPATFWITNPANTYRDNVAAGSQGSGFWIALPEHPVGASATDSVWNRRMPFQEFSGNSTHSNFKDGLHVDNGPDSKGGVELTVYEAHQDPQNLKSATLPVYFKDFTAYKNRNRGIWLRGKQHIVQGAVIADNAIGVTFASEETVLTDSLIVGESKNVGGLAQFDRSLPKPGDPNMNIYGFEFYDGKVGVENTHFAGFEPNALREAAALNVLQFTSFRMDIENYTDNLSFAKDTKRVYLPRLEGPSDPSEGSADGYRSALFIDMDGSVSGKPGHVVVVDNSFLLSQEGSCENRASWGAWVCEHTYGSLKVRAFDAAKASLSLVRDDDIEHISYGVRKSPSREFINNVLVNQGYDLEFAGGTPARLDIQLKGSKGQWVDLVLPFEQEPKVSLPSHPLVSYQRLSGFQTAMQTAYFYDRSSKQLHLRVYASQSPQPVFFRQ